MILLSATALGLLALFNVRLGRSLLYPPAVYCGLWAALELGLFLSGDAFFPVSSASLAIFFAGAAAFTTGGAMALRVQKPKYRQARPSFYDPAFVDRALWVGLTILVVALPFYWQRVHWLSGLSGVSDFWVGLRYQTSSGLENQTGFGIFSYLNAFSMVLALIASYRGRRGQSSRLQTIQTVVLIGLALAYNLLTMSRIGAILTIFALVGIFSVRQRRLNLKAILIFVLIFVLVFSVPAILLNKGGSVNGSLGQNTSGVLRSLQTYSLASLVAFDRSLQYPKSVGGNWLTLRFFSAIGRAAGYDVGVPNLVLDKTATPQQVNVYTAYFPYYRDFGLLGVVVIMSAIGAAATWLFLGALSGNPQAAVLYALVFGSLLLLGSQDLFLASLSFWIQAIFYTTVFYKLPLLWKRKGTLAGGGLKAGAAAGAPSP